MKTVNRKHIALVAGLLGLSASLATTTTANARPHDKDGRPGWNKRPDHRPGRPGRPGNGRPGRPGSTPSYSEGQRIEFPGYVQENTRGGGTFRVRGDNGVMYSVRPSESVRLRYGQRVRVSGTWRRGVVTNAGVNLL